MDGENKLGLTGIGWDIPETDLSGESDVSGDKRSQWEPRWLPLAFWMFTQRSLLGA